MPVSFKRSSGLDFHDRAPEPTIQDAHPDVSVASSRNLQRNKSERGRLQGLMRGSPSLPGFGNGPQRPTGWMERWDLWMVNEGGRRLFFFAWIFLHVLALILALIHYSLKDNLVTARTTFGATFAIARGAAVVLHIDVIFILLPVCRNFISLLRKTSLNSVIPFDKNITFHKATAWSIVFFSLVHVAAHMVNFARLAMADPDATNTGLRILAFLQANFATGPGATGWVMNVALGLMVWFALEKNRRAHFERFWYSHHLFIVFFINWQLHGMFCMIQPDRPPYCSWNTIGVFWVSLIKMSLSLTMILTFYFSATGLLVVSSGYLSVFCVK